eukprot:jgi/Botrbrau1/19176/Bobra.0077s0085.1
MLHRYRYYPLTAWILNQADLTTEALVSMNKEHRKQDTFDHVLQFGYNDISKETVLKAVIARPLPIGCRYSLWKMLAKLGGQAKY